MKRKFLTIICAFFYLLISNILFAENNKNEPFILNANKIINENKESIVIAVGDVEVIQGKEILRADYLKFNRNTNVAYAKGNVSILDEDGVIYFADYVEIDKGFQNGLSKNISILFPDDSRVAASTGTRFKGQISKLKKALYTACNCDDPNKNPTWQIKASEVTHDGNRKIIKYKNAFLFYFL